MASTPKLLIGLTGGIASGKSAVADRLQALGATIVDTDQVSREVVEPGTAGLAAVVERFGRGVLDTNGQLDRRRLREIVFADEQARSALNGILHPRIGERAMQKVRAAAGPYVVLVVPLLVEGGMADLVDRILVIDVPVETQIRRVMHRDGVDREHAESIIAAQANRESRLARADDVIVNDGDLEQLQARVDALHRFYLELAENHQ